MTEEAAGTRPYWEPRSIISGEFNDVDREALDLSIRLVLDRNDDIEPIIREYLRGGEWWEAATLACYGRQMDHLQLDPWESPPSWINEREIDDIIARGPGIENKGYSGALLLQRMITAHISKFHPQPIDALAAAKSKRRKQR